MRLYTETFLQYGVALLGPGWAGLWTPESKDGEFEGSYVRRFASEARVGDVLVLRNGTRTIIAIGLVASAYSFEHAFDDVNGWELQHARRVRWCRLPQEHQFGRAVFGGYPARFSRVWDQEVLDFAERFVNSPPTGWQVASLPNLPSAEPALAEVPEPLADLVAQARDLQPLYWKQDGFGERPSEDEMIVHFVVPLLRGLGWPVEQIAIKWHNIDVAVFRVLPRTADSCRFVIEAKRFGDGIEGAREQAKRYVGTLGLPRDVMVTDGIRYRMYGADRDFEPVAYANLAQLKLSAADLFTRMRKP
jgi:hypothetical protein